MVQRINIYQQIGSRRAETVCRALDTGLQMCGCETKITEFMPGKHVELDTTADAAAFYGFQVPLPSIMSAYKSLGKPAVHVDLGYWNRTEGGQLLGYHKVAVNARHPTSYFRKRRHADFRLKKAKRLKIEPWRERGEKIVVAGMSGKHAKSEHMAPGEWEREIVERIRKVTDRPIVYRPKPGDRTASPIKGCEYAKEGDIREVLENCHTLVTHHSNAALDAILAGLPVWAQDGVAAPVGYRDIGDIEGEFPMFDRYTWLCDVSYCQWSVPEIAAGNFWRHFESEGIV